MAITASDAMNDALEQCSELGFEMSPGFATHWAMGSETLIALGHAERVHEWAGLYPTKRKHYERPASDDPIDPADEASWRSALGDFDRRAGDWQALFERELTDRPWREVLVTWWPRLVPGVASGLTHGLIRTMHIVRAMASSPEEPTRLHHRELATGMAYWAGRYVEQPGPAELRGPARLPDVLATIPRLPASVHMSLHVKGLFFHMPDIPGWGAAASGLARPDDVRAGLSDLTLACAQVNLAHGDQFPIPLVHAVTAPAALRVMLDHLPEEMHLPSYVAMWQACAALVASFAPEPRRAEVDFEVPEGEAVPSERELVERAVEHGDEHAMKFAEACLREHALRPDPRYLLAPWRLLDSLRPYYRGARRAPAPQS